MKKRNLAFTFRAFYSDGNAELFGCRAANPTDLVFDFDGLMPFDEYYNYIDSKPSTHNILEKALNLYNHDKNPILRMEIINVFTNEVVDFITNQK